MWWPGISAEIKNTVMSCQICRELRNTKQKELLISTPLPKRPWKRIAVDLCEHNGHNYLIISDYYSRFLEILHLPSTTTSHVTQKLKAVFARFGIPNEVVSDNGPQFSSAEFQELAKRLDFKHITSSPHHPQGNSHIAGYRPTPCATTRVSPAELLMGRKIRTTLPTLEKNLQPRWPNRKSVMLKDKIEKDRQAFYYNRRNGAKNLSTLRPGDTVLTKLDHEKVWASPAVIRHESVTPRSYVIETEQGAVLRRNRRHLQAVPTPTLATKQAVHTLAPQTRDCGHSVYTY